MDVLVMGGGPAGLASAIAAAQAGFSVQVAEPCVGPLDKCCGEGLLPAAVSALGQLGIPADLLLQSGRALQGIRFHHHRSSVGAAFFAGTGVGLRRTRLHALLHERALQLGVRMVAATARLVDHQIGPQAVQLGSELCRPRWIIAADGLQSATRTAAGLRAPQGTRRRFALRQHFELAPSIAQREQVEVFWSTGAQAYLTPVDERCVGVAILAAHPMHDMATALDHFPALQRLLAHARPCSTPRGGVTLHRELPRVTQRSLALIGDAAGSVDAITGDGLSLAFLSALSLADSLRTGNLSAYEHAHRRLFRVAGIMSRALLGMGAHPALTTAAMGLLTHVPQLFPALLHLHTKTPPRSTTPHQEKALWLPAPTSTRSAT